jgi:hypothetical protein
MEWRPFFEDLERRGFLTQIRAFILELVEADEKQLRKMFRDVLVTDAKELAAIHAMQGRLSAYAKLLSTLKTLGERQKIPGRDVGKTEQRLTNDG